MKYSPKHSLNQWLKPRLNVLLKEKGGVAIRGEEGLSFLRCRKEGLMVVGGRRAIEIPAFISEMMKFCQEFHLDFFLFQKLNYVMAYFNQKHHIVNIQGVP